VIGIQPIPRHVPIGIIVKTWNTGECTRLCLDAIAEADRLPEEIVVVDLGEDAATRSYAEALTDRCAIGLHWLPVGHRLAPAAANRHALAAISPPLICLLDNDVLVPRNWLGPITAALASARVGLVGPIRPDPFLLYPGRAESTEAVLDELKGQGTPLAEMERAFTGGIPLDEFGRAVQRANDLQRAVALDFPSFLSSCCLCFDRAIVDDAGGIADPAFDARYGSEDVDLSWRVLQAGYELVRLANVFVLHLRHTSLEANRVDYSAELKTANQVLYGRWRKRLLTWAQARQRQGDTLADLSQRFIVRELIRNTSFGTDLVKDGSP
jgi:GT2 family glycosyltransferase